MDRRKFIRNSSLATMAFATGISNKGLASVSNISQNKNLKVGLIGSGWYGMVVAKAALEAGGVEIIAVADVDSNHLNNSINELTNLQGTKPKGFKDYKDLLNTTDLEAVIIGTPPHWHALQFIDACEKGLPIYCEKPLAYDVDEGRAMVNAAKKAGNIVQIGFQRRQNQAFKKAKQIIEEGQIGKIYQIGANIHFNASTHDTTPQTPPASLDWDAWCGPAPMLPYSPAIGHGPWRLEKEYGNGHLVDWGIHNIDIIRTIMGFNMPEIVEASGGIFVLKDKITTPDTLNATMQFDGIPVVWEHRMWGTGDLNSEYNNGVFFYGDKGTLFASDNRIVLKTRDTEQSIIDIPTPDMQEKHVAEFIEAVKTNNKDLISCNTDDAHNSTTAVQLAMIAYETESKLKWDGESKLTGNSEAQKHLARPYRKGYQRPVV